MTLRGENGGRCPPFQAGNAPGGNGDQYGENPSQLSLWSGNRFMDGRIPTTEDAESTKFLLGNPRRSSGFRHDSISPIQTPPGLTVASQRKCNPAATLTTMLNTAQHRRGRRPGSFARQIETQAVMRMAMAPSHTSRTPCIARTSGVWGFCGHGRNTSGVGVCFGAAPGVASVALRFSPSFALRSYGRACRQPRA